jgi:hypothetical protein
VSNLKEALDKARSETQDLHKRIDATTAKDHAAIRADVEVSADKAKQLAASLKTIVDGQRADAKKHIEDAASQLEDAAKHARDLAKASDAQLKERNRAMLGKVRDAAESLSQAVASERTKLAVK